MKILSKKNTFEIYKNLQDFNIEGFNLDNIVSLKNLFKGCKNLKNVQIYDTHNIKDNHFMYSDSSLTNIDLQVM